MKATESDELVLGFDIRDKKAASIQMWSRDRIENYLLRPEVSHVFSVDTQVWASLCSSPRSGNRARDLLDTIEEAEEELKVVCKRTNELTMLGITLITKEKSAACIQRMLTQYRAELKVSDLPNNCLLGYDIADSVLLSGLSNCGYGSYHQIKRNRWSEFLNSHHLFKELPKALEFCKDTENRVPEHSPFFVFGLVEVLARPGAVDNS